MIWFAHVMINATMTEFAHIIYGHARRRIIVKVASKNLAVVIIYAHCWPLYVLKTDTLWTICYE